MREVRVGVVGAGALGELHARIYAKEPGCRLVAVVDVQAERARRVAIETGAEPYFDFREVLGRVDAVSLAVPTELHAALGSELLRQGVHVLVEKPMASNLAEADELIEAARASGSLLQVGHSERFNPAVLAVRPFLNQPGFFEAHRLGVFVARSLDIDVVLDLMIHDLDLILNMADSPVKELRAIGIPVLTHKVDIANARIEFENGCVANLTASRVSREKIRKLRFFQPHDYVSLDLHSQEVEILSLVGESGQSRKIVERNLKVQREKPLSLELRTFLAALGAFSEDWPLQGCSGEEGRQTLAFALDIVTAMKQKETGSL